MTPKGGAVLGCVMGHAMADAGLALPDILLPNRRPSVVAVRHLSAYAAHCIAGASFSDIGRFLKQDRTSIATAIANLEDRRDDLKFDEALICLERFFDGRL